MDQLESQPGPSRPQAYFDPDTPDMSEQEFSASLENVIAKPAFVLNDEADAEIGPGTACQAAGATQDAAPGPPGCAASDRVNTSEEQEDSQSRTRERISDPTVTPSEWREQVSAKVNSYKSRSRHKPRYPSLQLQFDDSSYRARPGLENARQTAPATFSQSVAAEIVAMQPVARIESGPPRITMEATARVLEFPRPAPPAYDPDELAEPVFGRPRILEAPEFVPAPPAMGGILIEPPPQPEPERRAGFDVPLQSAPLSRRLWAGAVDLLLVAIAIATFAYIFVRITEVVPPPKIVAELCAALVAIFWPAYQYAFSVFSESTPGLRLAKLQIQRFDGTPAPRSLRRWRVLASYLSAASLLLGYAWYFLDEDRLTWHDRITRTHLAPSRG